MTGPAPVPEWLTTLVARIDDLPAIVLHDMTPPADGRRSAVLILFGPDPAGGEDVLLTERSPDLRAHPGQVAFPGGALDPDDGSAARAALREAQEETGLDLDGVQVLGELPDLYLNVSGFVVTPVLAWWARPSPVAPGDPAEVARVARVPVAELLDASNRFTVRYGGRDAGPGFTAQGLFVWGFTARLLHFVLSEAGLESDWDTGRFADLQAVSRVGERLGPAVFSLPGGAG